MFVISTNTIQIKFRHRAHRGTGGAAYATDAPGGAGRTPSTGSSRLARRMPQTPRPWPVARGGPWWAPRGTGGAGRTLSTGSSRLARRMATDAPPVVDAPPWNRRRWENPQHRLFQAGAADGCGTGRAEKTPSTGSSRPVRRMPQTPRPWLRPQTQPWQPWPRGRPVEQAGLGEPPAPALPAPALPGWCGGCHRHRRPAVEQAALGEPPAPALPGRCGGWPQTPRPWWTPRRGTGGVGRTPSTGSSRPVPGAARRTSSSRPARPALPAGEVI